MNDFSNMARRVDDDPFNDLKPWNEARAGGVSATKSARGAATYITPGEQSAKPKLRTARSLQGRSFPPIRWIVPGLLPEGLTILMGAPKLGKSWLTLDFALGVARGSEVLGQTCEQGDVLLLALEDNERRLQDRLTKIAGEGDWPEALAYATDWPRLNNGGLKEIEAWIDGAQKPRLIIVDTLAMVKPSATGKGNAYEQDVAALRPLHQLASARRVSVVVVTHKRKMEADDPLEGISGTNGLTGTADTTIALIRGTGQGEGKIYGRGRDLAELERDVVLKDCRWTINGEPLEANKGDTWSKIMRAVREGHGTPTEITEATGIPYDNVCQHLTRMAKAGALIKAGRGIYGFPDQVSVVSGVSVSAGVPDTPDTTDRQRGGDFQ
ncbi:AAA family ATPase [Gemmobacter sp. LW-1]|uniref:AAA family ATPase n=1 Tax=Gemmobacter sp. LW-1 TaxID=1529005 RepID=UPI0006C7673C|nr:AAA family ATPase [Gemmobacter sp. LW-1]